MIKKHDLDMIYVTDPGHGGPGLAANAYLEGTYSEVYPNISLDEQGMKRLFTQSRMRPNIVRRFDRAA
jgi:xylulose-5-phosphate/fructose-6-phosphate phosphoketolase